MVDCVWSEGCFNCKQSVHIHSIGGDGFEHVKIPNTCIIYSSSSPKQPSQMKNTHTQTHLHKQKITPKTHHCSGYAISARLIIIYKTQNSLHIICLHRFCIVNRKTKAQHYFASFNETETRAWAWFCIPLYIICGTMNAHIADCQGIECYMRQEECNWYFPWRRV